MLSKSKILLIITLCRCEAMSTLRLKRSGCATCDSTSTSVQCHTVEKASCIPCSLRSVLNKGEKRFCCDNCRIVAATVSARPRWVLRAALCLTEEQKLQDCHRLQQAISLAACIQFAMPLLCLSNLLSSLQLWKTCELENEYCRFTGCELRKDYQMGNM